MATSFSLIDGGTIGVGGAKWTFDDTNDDISTTAKIGIGTTSPGEKLEIGHYGTAIGDLTLRMTNHATNLHATSLVEYDLVVSDIDAGTGLGNGKFSIGYRVSKSATRAERLTIDNTGNVGIGTTAPTSKLHISGPVTNTTAYSITNPLLKLTQTNASSPWDFTGIVIQSGGYSHTIGMSLNTFQIKAKGDSIYGGIEFIVGAGTTTAMNISHTGDVGIGTSSPVKKLHVKVGGLNNPLYENNGANNTDAWSTLNTLNVDNSILGPASYGGYLYFYYRYSSGTNAGFKINSSGASGTFTGKHQSYSKNTSILQNISLQNYVGLIVSSQGEYITYKDNSRTEDINIDDTWPIVDLSNSNNDKKVYGIISNYISSSVKEKDYSDDGFSNGLDGRIRINSVGEGAIWLCNKNGTIENGDYITSTTVTGYGGKQILNEEFLTRYTVAKITCDCDFSLTKVVKKQIKLVDDPTGKVISFDSQGNIEYENILDPGGGIQMVYPLETRFLQSDGTQLTDEADYTTRLANGESVYIACFVGCTYHCG